MDDLFVCCKQQQFGYCRSGCCWLLLVVVGCCCCWLLLVVVGCWLCLLLLVVVVVAVAYCSDNVVE